MFSLSRTFHEEYIIKIQNMHIFFNEYFLTNASISRYLGSCDGLVSTQT